MIRPFDPALRTAPRTAALLGGLGLVLARAAYEVPKASVSRLTLVYKPAFLDGATFRVPLFQ